MTDTRDTTERRMAYEDDDGIDGPWERAMDRAITHDREVDAASFCPYESRRPMPFRADHPEDCGNGSGWLCDRCKEDRADRRLSSLLRSMGAIVDGR